MPSESRLDALFREQEKVANIASAATGLIMSLCFFVLPAVWSNIFHVIPIPVASVPAGTYDAWSDLKDLL